jgi:hypothetical protein
LPGVAAPPRRLLKVTPLIVSDNNEIAIRSILKGGNYAQLASEIERQKNQFLAGGLP